MKSTCLTLPIFLEVLFGSVHFLADKEEKLSIQGKLSPKLKVHIQLYHRILVPLEIPMKMDLSILLSGLKYLVSLFIKAF